MKVSGTRLFEDIVLPEVELSLSASGLLIPQNFPRKTRVLPRIDFDKRQILRYEVVLLGKV